MHVITRQDDSYANLHKSVRCKLWLAPLLPVSGMGFLILHRTSRNRMAPGAAGHGYACNPCLRSWYGGRGSKYDLTELFRSSWFMLCVL
jgi:hypothetical protein